MTAIDRLLTIAKGEAGETESPAGEQPHEVRRGLRLGRSARGVEARSWV